MRKLFVIARREYLAAVRTKAFLVGLILAPLLMSGGFVGMALFSGHVDVTDQRLAIIDHSGLLAPALAKDAQQRNSAEVFEPGTGKKIKPPYLIEIVEPDRENPDRQRLALSNRVRKKSLHAFLEIGAGLIHPKEGSDSTVRYHARNGALDDLRGWVAAHLTREVRRRRLADAGVDLSQTPHLLEPVQVASLGLATLDKQTGAIVPAERRGEAEAVLLPIAAQILMFMLLMMGATPLIQTIMEEKTQRIAEVMLASVTPFQLMLGKLLGGVAVALTGSIVYFGGSIVTLTSMSLSAYIPYQVLPWFFAYLVGAIFLFGAMFAALGSACSDPKDAQTLQLPAMIPLILPMFLLGPFLKEPHSPLATVLSLLPPFSPTLMIMRMSTPAGVPAWQPWVGLLGVLLFGAGVVWVGGRIFRIGILVQGRPPRFLDLLRWALKG